MLGTPEHNCDWHPAGLMRSLQLPLYAGRVPGSVRTGVQVAFEHCERPDNQAPPKQFEVQYEQYKNNGILAQTLVSGCNTRAVSLRNEQLRLDAVAE